MSTPIARLPEARRWRGAGWRAVEAQHKNATMALVDGDANRQSILEGIIDGVKPVLPPEAQGLHFLLATPFRYLPPPPSGSRFRGRYDAAVFYGAADPRTACAEAGYWRLRFWIDSDALAKKTGSMPMTLFEFHGATARMIDLSKAPLNARREEWTQPDDYAATQALASLARTQGIELIISESVRQPPSGKCLNILTPAVFKAVREPYRHLIQNWNLYLKPPSEAIWQRDLTSDRFEFNYRMPQAAGS